MNQKLLLPFDIYERHKSVSMFIESGDSVLDVGGVLGALALFCPKAKITVSNLVSGDIIADATQHDFGQDVFDIVCSIDVLEHIEPKNRKNFFASLIKTARKRVIISAPLGTAKHQRYEEEALQFLMNNNQQSQYLEEHIKMGLPTKEEIITLAKGYKYQVFYSGYLPLTKYLFYILNYQLPNPKLNKFFFFLKTTLNPFLNIVVYPLVRRLPFSEDRVRFYLVVNKQ